MSTDVVMPQMGESITEGTITRWLKQVGDKVERDEMIFEISTDKVDAEIPSPIAGTLTEIRVKEGETVEVGTIVATVGDGNGAQAPAPQTAAAAPPPPPPPTPQQPSVASPQIFTPSSPGGSETVAASDYSAQSSPTEQKAASPDVETGTAEQSVEDLRRTRSSPLVRKIAAEHKIDISRLEGTGSSGRVTKNDILSFIESGADAPATPAAQPTAQPQAPSPAMPPMQVPSAPPAEGDRVETMSVMRRKIAEHMITSQHTSAHVATVYEIDMTRVAALRERSKGQFQQATGTKLTFMPFIFQAVTSAIRQYPVFNSQVSGDQIIYKRDINLGLAVALDWGLIVPVIKRADELSLSGLARSANDLADRARAKQLKPDEVAGGTFTITNPGVFGGLFGTPIINQPQVAILAIGTIEKRPRVMQDPDGNDYLAIRTMAYFALSYDHRIVDGADAERFLSHVKQTLEAGQFAV